MSVTSDPMVEVVRRAVDGDRTALEQVCRELQDPVHRLALRMFTRPEDAADATQEALVRIVTHLGKFDGRSKLTTWAYTVAARQFLRTRRRTIEDTVVSPEAFAAWLDTHRATPSAADMASVEFEELCGDVRIASTYGMLLCLSRELRLAYLLGDVIGFTHTEGADALGIAPAAFRQRLARARSTMRGLMAQRCGLVRKTNPCRCSHLVDASISQGLADPEAPVYARHPGATAPIPAGTIAAAAAELDEAEAIAEVFRSHPGWRAPAQVWQQVRTSLPVLTGDPCAPSDAAVE